MKGCVSIGCIYRIPGVQGGVIMIGFELSVIMAAIVVTLVAIGLSAKLIADLRSKGQNKD